MKLPAFINQILHSFYGFQDNRVQRGAQVTNAQNNNCLAHLDKCQVNYCHHLSSVIRLSVNFLKNQFWKCKYRWQELLFY